MEESQIIQDRKIVHVAEAEVNSDVIALYMLSKRYHLDLVSLLALYEVYGKDIFLFFCIMCGDKGCSIIGKSSEELDLSKSHFDPIGETSLKLIVTKAKKISDALRRNDPEGLTNASKPVYEYLKKYCVYDPKTRANYLNFYTLIEIDETPEPKAVKKVKNAPKTRRS